MTDKRFNALHILAIFLAMAFALDVTEAPQGFKAAPVAQLKPDPDCEFLQQTEVAKKIREYQGEKAVAQ